MPPLNQKAGQRKPKPEFWEKNHNLKIIMIGREKVDLNANKRNQEERGFVYIQANFFA